MNNGDLIKISDLKLGQKLEGDNEVLTIIKKTKSLSIYRLDNILVKGDHVVRKGDKWLRVKELEEESYTWL